MVMAQNAQRNGTEMLGNNITIRTITLPVAGPEFVIAYLHCRTWSLDPDLNVGTITIRDLEPVWNLSLTECVQREQFRVWSLNPSRYSSPCPEM